MHRIVATNLTDLRAEPSFLSERLTQVLNGWRLEILEERDEWCRVRQTDGYEGWAYAPFLSKSPAPTPTHIIAEPIAPVYAARQASAHPATLLLAGTGVRVGETLGEHLRIELAGDMFAGGWVAADHVRALGQLPIPAANARREMIDSARRLTGVYYLWGGCSAWGIDCSGLVQLVHRLCGYTIPRDSHMQFSAGRAIDPPFQPGDLLFFHAESNRDKITHVGISTGGWRMIHSSRGRNGVYEDDVEQINLRHRFAGARSFMDGA